MGSSDEVKIAFVIGNGTSRLKFDVSKLSNYGVTYGCNLQIETMPLDNTIAVDRAVLVHLLSQGYDKRTNLWTRNRWFRVLDAGNTKSLEDPIPNPQQRWDNEIHWGSGTHAASLAAKQGASIICMIGFDLWPNADNPTNVYYGQEPFYQASQPDPACWIYQFAKLFELYPTISFVQIQPKSWKTPDEWTADNFSRDTYSGLREWLKTLD